VPIFVSFMESYVMKKVTATDLRTIRTKNAIVNAFQQLADQNDISHITVKDLAELAGINRKTFYSHYDSIDALEHALIQHLIEQIREIVQHEQPQEFRETLRNIYRYLCNLPLWCRNLMCAKDNPVSQQIFIELMGAHISAFQPQDDPAQMPRYMYLRYIAAASIELFKVWHESSGSISQEAFLDMATGLICFGEQHMLMQHN
jgi:AcrR family transcriptional regulator